LLILGVIVRNAGTKNKDYTAKFHYFAYYFGLIIWK
jgi:hypothetical protein